MLQCASGVASWTSSLPSLLAGDWVSWQISLPIDTSLLVSFWSGTEGRLRLYMKSTLLFKAGSAVQLAR